MPNEKKKKKIETKPPKDSEQNSELASHWEVWGENTYTPWYNRFLANGSSNPPGDPPPQPPGFGN